MVRYKYGKISLTDLFKSFYTQNLLYKEGMKKVIVAMSGGVDSSVSAALLQEQGFEVEGVFMKNWSPETIQTLTDCPWEQDQLDAAAVCKVLGIPFRSINFEREYKELVVDYFLSEYAAGRTPNPDIMCNKEIKFKVFLEEAKKAGADFIATGHYVQKVEIDGRYYLKRGVDPSKDQSYFLWTLDQDQIASSLFPVGGMPKSEVRKLAETFKLPTAKKKDSQGICFIGHIDLKKFLMEQITARSGEVYLLPKEGDFNERIMKASLIGEHQGSMFYTIGERAGELINNGLYRKLRAGVDVPPVYVIHKDFRQNRLYITDDRTDRHFLSNSFDLEEEMNVVDQQGITCQIRYQQSEEIQVKDIKNNSVALLESVWAAASGQSAVFYRDDLVIGGGIIRTVHV